MTHCACVCGCVSVAVAVWLCVWLCLCARVCGRLLHDMQAINSVGHSPPAGLGARVTTLDTPAKPTNLRIGEVTSKSVQVCWDNPDVAGDDATTPRAGAMADGHTPWAAAVERVCVRWMTASGDMFRVRGGTIGLGASTHTPSMHHTRQRHGIL